MNPNVEFIESSHTYLVDGRPYISITTLLQRVGIIEHWFFTPGSADRGKEIHELTQLTDLQQPISNHAYDGYLEAWRRFKEDSGFQIREIEKVVVHHPFKYAGTIDRVGILEGNQAIIDIKSGVFQDWHGIQLAAYRLAHGNDSARMCGVYLRQNGKYRLREFNSAYYGEIFLTALLAYYKKYGRWSELYERVW